MTGHDLRLALRAGTAEAHRATEDVVGGVGTKPLYARYLAGMYSFRAPIEAAFSSLAFPEEFAGWRPTPVEKAMRADLADLGLPEPPPRDAFAVPEDLSGLLGLCYVLEGSSLGARLLLREVAAIGLDAGFGARHLAVQSGNPAHWTAFTRLIETLPADAGRAVDVANQAFAAAGRHLQSAPHVVESAG